MPGVPVTTTDASYPFSQVLFFFFFLREVQIIKTRVLDKPAKKLSNILANA